MSNRTSKGLFPTPRVVEHPSQQPLCEGIIGYWSLSLLTIISLDIRPWLLELPFCPPERAYLALSSSSCHFPQPVILYIDLSEPAACSSQFIIAFGRKLGFQHDNKVIDARSLAEDTTHATRGVSGNELLLLTDPDEKMTDISVQWTRYR